MTGKISGDVGELRVVLFEDIHESAERYLRDQGFRHVERLKPALEGDELREVASRAHLLGIRSRTQVDAACVDAGKDLLAVGCFCIGTNQVDLRHAGAAGIPVFNAPHSNTRSVAEIVIAFIVMLVRDVHRRSLAAHAGRWMKSVGSAQELRGKTLGIVGYGHIGSQVSVLAESLGMTVLYHDVEVKLPLGNARPVKDLDELLSRADVVTCHVPDTPLTRGMIGAAQLDRMKKGAHLVNTSRGTVVDLDALAARLRSGAIGGAAIDVFPEEPSGNDVEFESPLRGIENVILTPHVAGSTVEAQENIGAEVARKLASFARCGNTVGSVNFPQMSLADATTSSRILHVHANVPGVVRRINDIVADQGLNVAREELQTHGEIGYVALDVEGSVPPTLMESIREVSGTIRTRLVHA